MTGTSAIAHLHNVETDVLEQRLDELGTHHATAKTEADRVDTLVQDVQGFLVGLNRIVHGNVLTNIPLVVVFLVAAHERELSGESFGGLQVLQVLATVERLHVKTFIGSPHEPLLEVGSFQVYLNLVQPLLSGGRGKLGEEFLFVV